MGAFIVSGFHSSARAALHETDDAKENDERRWMGVAISDGTRSKPVGKGQIVFPGDLLLNELHVMPLEDFARLVAEIEKTDPEVLGEPEMTQAVLEHRGSETQHVMCVDVLGYKQIVESNPGTTTRTRIRYAGGLYEATFGQKGIEIESTSEARSGPANLVFLAHQLSGGRFPQLTGPPKNAGFCADHLVVASDSLYGVYKEPLQVLQASIHAIRWCLQSVDPMSRHDAIRVGIGSGTSVRLCDSDEDEAVNGLRNKGHVVAMYYGTGYIEAYLAERDLCQGRGPCIVAARSFRERISGQIKDLEESGWLAPHPTIPDAFDVNYLIDLLDEDVRKYRERLECLGAACTARAPAKRQDEYRERFVKSLRDFDRYDELRRKKSRNDTRNT